MALSASKERTPNDWFGVGWLVGLLRSESYLFLVFICFVMVFLVFLVGWLVFSGFGISWILCLCVGLWVFLCVSPFLFFEAE